MATVYQEGDQLLISVTPEEAQHLHPGDTVYVIKVEDRAPTPDFDRLLDQVLTEFAPGLDYLKDK